MPSLFYIHIVRSPRERMKPVIDVVVHSSYISIPLLYGFVQIHQCRRNVIKKTSTIGGPMTVIKINRFEEHNKLFILYCINGVSMSYIILPIRFYRRKKW